MWIVVVPIAFLVVFLVALFIDASFLDGRYLNRANVTAAQLKQTLEIVLSQGDRPIESWDPIPQDWISDKMHIPLKDPRLDAIRLSVVLAIGDSNNFNELTPEAKLRIQEGIDRLLLV